MQNHSTDKQARTGRNRLKVVLALTYVILIILLLLRSCNPWHIHVPRPLYPQPTIPEDTTGIEERARNIGSQGELKITLLWDFDADIDLHVKQPNGNEINYENKYDPSTGGELDVDNRRGGSGAAENVYWRKPSSGQYQVNVVYYGASEPGNKRGSGPCTVIVFQEGQSPQHYTLQMNHINDRANVCTVTIP